ncbi:MAG: hypothetical protein IJ642_03410 [Oscillospiraceae bacterium]|nr:hypothetical protein [Oscillospiraceae bacterium]
MSKKRNLNQYIPQQNRIHKYKTIQQLQSQTTHASVTDYKLIENLIQKMTVLPIECISSDILNPAAIILQEQNPGLAMPSTLKEFLQQIRQYAGNGDSAEYQRLLLLLTCL